MLAVTLNSRKENTVPNRNFPKGESTRSPDRSATILRWCHWPSLIAGAAIGFAAVHLHTTNTLLTEVKQLEQQITDVDSRTQQLAETSESAYEASSLLGSLVTQGERVTEARKALDSVRDLQRTLALSAQKTDEARVIADRWQALSNHLVAAHQQQTKTFEAVAEIDALQQDVIALGDTAVSAQPQLEASRAVLTDVANLQAQLAATEGVTERVQSAVAGIDELQQRLVAAGEQTDAASQTADGLVALQQRLSSATNSDAAKQNAERLIALQESLSGQTPHIAAGIENLELLADFQDELTEQLDRVESLRRQMTELMLLETTVSRTVSALSPLTDLASLRRLDDAEVREIARTMLDRRRERVAAAESKYDADEAEVAEASDEDRLVPEPSVE